MSNISGRPLTMNTGKRPPRHANHDMSLIKRPHLAVHSQPRRYVRPPPLAPPAPPTTRALPQQNLRIPAEVIENIISQSVDTELTNHLESSLYDGYRHFSFNVTINGVCVSDCRPMLRRLRDLALVNKKSKQIVQNKVSQHANYVERLAREPQEKETKQVEETRVQDRAERLKRVTMCLGGLRLDGGGLL